MKMASDEERYSLGFRDGEVFALKQAVAHLRGTWDRAADILEKMIIEKEVAPMGPLKKPL